jgi:hypothetical protein
MIIPNKIQQYNHSCKPENRQVHLSVTDCGFKFYLLLFLTTFSTSSTFKRKTFKLANSVNVWLSCVWRKDNAPSPQRMFTTEPWLYLTRSNSITTAVSQKIDKSIYLWPIVFVCRRKGKRKESFEQGSVLFTYSAFKYIANKTHGNSSFWIFFDTVCVQINNICKSNKKKKKQPYQLRQKSCTCFTICSYRYTNMHTHIKALFNTFNCVAAIFIAYLFT